MRSHQLYCFFLFFVCVLRYALFLPYVLSNSCITHTHTHTHTNRGKQKLDCRGEHLLGTNDVRTWQSSLCSAVHFITGVIHTKRKCVCAYPCVCVCLFSLAVFWTADHKQAWGLSIVISLVQLCPLLLAHMRARTHTHTQLSPHYLQPHPLSKWVQGQ